MRAPIWQKAMWPLLVLVGIPGQALAHLVNTGFGPFYDGIVHVLATPEDLLLIVALTLLAGLRGAPCGRAVLCVLPVAWLAGAVVGGMTGLAVDMPVLSAALLIAVGVLVAVDLRLSLVWVAALALICGVLHGYFNGASLARARVGGLAVVGIASAVFVLVSLLAGQVTALRAYWTRIVVRVAGSWLTAIGLLMLGWALR
jgi:hydrogenase/urease accessory protein HupE